MADIYGTNGNDTLDGTSGEDNIFGFDGNDTIDGGAGNDVVIGDGGDDVLLGGAGADFINGGDGNDVIYADEQDTHVRGDAGHDVVYIQGSVGVNWILENFYYTGIEELHGTSGDDSVNNYGVADMAIYGEGGDDTLMGSLGNQTLDGGAGNDLLSGWSGDDVLRGGNGDDQLTGDWGHDVLTGGAGVDLMNGGDGDDLLNADANDLYVRGDAGYDKVYIEGSTGVNWYIDGFYKSGFEEVHGSGSADTIVSWEPTAVSLFGRGGDDFLAGNSGNDTLAGGTENDTLYGGDGDDRYLFNLGDGIDTIQDTSSGAGNRIVFGAGIGQQDLTLIHDQLSQILTIQVGATGDAIRLVNFDPNGVSGSMVISTLFFDDGSQVSLADLLGLGSGSGATITGTNGDDFLQGTAGGDVIEGLAGNDMLDGLGGDDIITGGAGADQLFGGNGNDVLNVDAADFLVMGGDGYDVAYVNDSQSVYWYIDDFGSMSGLEEIHGGAGNDTLRYVGQNAVNLFGGDGADYLSGSAGTDVLDGGDGTDVLEGQDGHNILRGGAGGDSLTGGTGNDVLQGGTGADYMWGGSGDDTYIVDDVGDQVSESDFFSGNDTIESSVNVFGADTGIENITLTGVTADWVNGNGRDNVIAGNSLNNYLFDGWAGDDTLRGNGKVACPSISPLSLYFSPMLRLKRIPRKGQGMRKRNLKGGRMSDRHGLLHLCKAICLVLTLGVSMSAYATDTFTWKEEVLLHDGKKIIVERSDTYDSSMNHEIGQGAPLAEHKTTFMIPGTSQTVTWKSDNRSFAEPEHLDLLSLDVLDGVPFVATTPYRSFAYEKWGRPNPPYVFFRYVYRWERISMKEFPEQFKINVVAHSLQHEPYKKKVMAENREYGFVRAQTVTEINREPGSGKEYYSILRTPIDYGPPRSEHKGFKAPHPIPPSNTTDGGK